MTFSRAKPTGYTDDIDTLPADEINTIDINQSRALDGTAGGPYAPSSALVIDGQGIQTNKLELDGDVDVKTGAVATFESGSTLAVDTGATINIDDDINLQTTVPATVALIVKTPFTGTGATDGTNLVIEAQPGQDQTGGADNNDGGFLEVVGGVPGLLGSGALGGNGGVYLKPTNRGPAPGAAPAGTYFGCFSFQIPANGTINNRVAKIMGINRTAEVEVNAIVRISSTVRWSGRARFMLDSDGAGVVTFTSHPGNPIEDHNNGYTTPPVLSVVGSGGVASGFSVGVTDNDVLNVISECTLRWSCSVSEAI